MTSHQSSADRKNHHARHGESLRGSHDGPVGRGYRFAPYELAFCGRSGAGKTTLITRLIRDLSPSYRIAYVKHDAHGFAMDREGKDTFRATESGAHAVFINDAERFALLGTGEIDAPLASLLFPDVDFVFAEGYRRSELAKIVVVDPDGEILDEVESGEIGRVAALILRGDAAQGVAERARRVARSIGLRGAGLSAEGASSDASSRQAPSNEAGSNEASSGEASFTEAEPALLSADDLPAIRELVLRHFAAQAAAVPLYGLVLGGGRSTRMHREKAAIAYHGVPQARWAAELLSSVCRRVYVSTRADQGGEPVFDGLEQIHDRFVDIGPMGGILTALHAHPEAAWLVLGCDLPFVTLETLEELIRRRDPFRFATCYDSLGDGLPEPLCAIYEPSYRARLHQFLAAGRTCPRKALIQSRCRRIPLLDPRALDNVNDPQESLAASALLARRKG